MDITHIKDNVDLISLGEKRIYLVGTAHISKSSAELAEETIREVRPEVVAIELCQGRYDSLKDPERWKKTNIISVLREGKAYVLFTQLMLAAFQKKMGDKLQVKPGIEMLRSAEVANEIGAKILLADRDIRTTLKRSWAAIGAWSLTKLFFSSLFASFDSKEIEEKEIEALKTGDALEALMKEFSDSLPEIQNSLIDERDRFMVSKIRECDAKSIVAIVGAGHVPGMKRYINEEINRALLEEIPPPSLMSKILKWGIPALIVGLFVAGFFFSGASASFEMAKAWVIYTGAFAALGAAISLGHPLSILAAFVAAPITTLHPFLAAGWISGLVEAIIRKPTVADFETIAADLTSVRGIWTNRLARVFLIMILTNLTTTIGVIWGVKVLASLVK